VIVFDGLLTFSRSEPLTGRQVRSSNSRGVLDHFAKHLIAINGLQAGRQPFCRRRCRRRLHPGSQRCHPAVIRASQRYIADVGWGGDLGEGTGDVGGATEHFLIKNYARLSHLALQSVTGRLVGRRWPADPPSAVYSSLACTAVRPPIRSRSEYRPFRINTSVESRRKARWMALVYYHHRRRRHTCDVCTCPAQNSDIPECTTPRVTSRDTLVVTCRRRSRPSRCRDEYRRRPSADRPTDRTGLRVEADTVVSRRSYFRRRRRDKNSW